VVGLIINFLDDATADLANRQITSLPPSGLATNGTVYRTAFFTTA